MQQSNIKYCRVDSTFKVGETSQINMFTYMYAFKYTLSGEVSETKVVMFILSSV